MSRFVAYLALQATREGQASHAHVHEIINGLERRGWTIDLYEPWYTGGVFLPGPARRLYAFLLVQIRLLTRLGRYKALYVRSHTAAFPVVWYAKIRKVPVVLEVNGPPEDLFLAWPWTRRIATFLRWLGRSQRRMASALIVVTPQLRDLYAAEVGPEKKIAVIPNGANVDLFYPGASTAHLLPTNYVVFFGALAKWQGIDALLHAVEHPHWPEGLSLVVIGGGEFSTQVEAAASRNPRVVYLGRLPYGQVPGIVASAIAGVSPQNDVGGRSRTGLSPLKVYETLACGVPVIVTRFPGLADFVTEHQVGLVVEPDSAEELARAVATLYVDSDLRQTMGVRGRTLVLQGHSWDKRAADTSELLLQLREGW